MNAMLDSNTLLTSRKPGTDPNSVRIRSFAGAHGNSEHYITVEAPAGLPFAAQLEFVEQRYAAAIHALGLSEASAMFRRIHLSDILNQTAAVRASRLSDHNEQYPVAVSLVQQAPMSGAKIALLAHHVEDAEQHPRQRQNDGQIVFHRHGLQHLWSTQLCAGSDSVPPTPADQQTTLVFDQLTDALARLDGTLLDHCVRTWIYLKDVDVYYKDMVESRIRLFNQHGLTRDTHYIASTGIEGACSHRADLIMMDAYSIVGLQPQQMSWLNDFDRLCSAGDYNVTFERGTRIAWRDRSHHFISGTASIDTAGEVVHPGDVLQQLDVALENVDALLRSGGSTLDDMMYLLVYLRDPSDHQAVRARLTERLPNLPIVIVQGPVCRPEWLIEIEGIAIAAERNPTLPEF